MEYLYHRNIKLPLIGFGTWNIGDDPLKEQQEIDALMWAYKKYDMFLVDTAEMYGNGKSERLVGKFLKLVDRDKIYIVDKILPENMKSGRYLQSCKKSLENLGVSCIDLYLLHWNIEGLNLDKMVKNMEHLKKLGLIKNWGVSNFDTHEMEELFKVEEGHKCFLNQCLYNLKNREVEYDLLKFCKDNDVLFMSYSPLLNDRKTKEEFVSNPYFEEIVEKEDLTNESLLLSFVIRNKDLITVFKTSEISHLDSNMKNVFKPLSKESLNKLETLSSCPKNKKYIQYI